MAKPVTQKIKLLSTAGTGFFYDDEEEPAHRDREARRSRSTIPSRKHVDFKETKIK